MLDWLMEKAGRDRYAILSSSPPGVPETMRVLFANFDDVCAFVEQFQVPNRTDRRAPEAMRPPERPRCETRWETAVSTEIREGTETHLCCVPLARPGLCGPLPIDDVAGNRHPE